MNNEQTEIVVTEKELVINMLISAWDAQNKRFADFLDKISDEELSAEAAPGRNTGTYLLGHLTAASDGMLKIMGVSDKLYPELEELFITSPDKSSKTFPAISTLKEQYHAVTNELHKHFSKMTSDDWFGRHMSVTVEDFAREPHRNKLNILISRTSHFAMHFGQMLYLKKK